MDEIRVDLVEGLTSHVQELLLDAREITVEQVETGTVVLLEGETASEMVVVAEGSLEVVKLTRQKPETVLGRRGQGSLLGEITFIHAWLKPSVAYTATVRAAEASTIVRIPHAYVRSIIQSFEEAGSVLLRNIIKTILRKQEAMLEATTDHAALMDMGGKMASLLALMSEQAHAAHVQTVVDKTMLERLVRSMTPTDFFRE